MKIHTGDKPFQYDICRRAYTTNSDLTRHKRIHKGHSNVICVKRHIYRVPAHLKSLERTHSAEKPFKCDICKQAFKQQEQLKSHTRTHTGEKPYQCDKAFSLLCNLKLHKRTHTGEKLYSCDSCGKTFSDRSFFNNKT